MNTNTHFVIGIRNKIPYKISGPDYIVTDNSDYTLELVPDEQWEGMETKTVIYAYDNGTAVHNPINGNQDKIPIVQTSGNLHIGVTAGDIRTSTWVSVPIRGSIRRKAGAGIKPPAPDVYDKIIDMIGKQTGIKSVEIQEGSVTDEGGVGETTVYYLVITEKNGKMFKEKLPNLEVDPKQIVKLQNGAPTEETEGIQNQLLINKDDWTIYVCTGAVLVMGEYTYFWQQIGGTGGDVGTDITLGITGAVVGQTVKITEVDENGRPVKWEAADIPAQTDIDNTLSIEGSAADAKAVGDKVAKLSSAIANIPSGKDGVGIQSVVQTTTSTEDGGTNVVTVTTSDGTSSTFQVKNGSKGSTGKAGADGHTPVKGTDYFTAADKREIAEEAAGMVSIPDKLPNPNALTFTGAVTGIYDGSEPLNVEIPSGGSGGSAEPGYKDATTLFDVTLDDTTGGLKSYEYDVSGIEKTDVIIINILFPESYSGQISIANQSSMIAREFPSSVKGMAIGLKVMNGRYMHSCVSSANINARLDMPLSLFYGQLSGASGFERPNAPDTITKLKFTLSSAFVSGTRIRAYRW